MEETKQLEALRRILQDIERNDPSFLTFRGDKNNKALHYDIRNDLIYEAVYEARKLGFNAGFSIHTPVMEIIKNGWDYRFGVVAFIELPTGQISYHIESPDIEFDGHSHKEKHRRIKKFIKEEVPHETIARI